jgi:hypothetical protein
MEIIEVGIVMNVIDEHPDSSFNENNWCLKCNVWEWFVPEKQEFSMKIIDFWIIMNVIDEHLENQEI